MPEKRVDRAPVEKVGGTQDRGPWPKDLEEIAVDDRLQRPVVMGEGVIQEAEVTITDIRQHIRPDGTETDGYAVTFQFDHGGGV